MKANLRRFVLVPFLGLSCVPGLATPDEPQPITAINFSRSVRNTEQATPLSPYASELPGAAESVASPVRVSETYGKLPLSFEANAGQSDPAVKFLSRGPGYSLFLTPTEAVLSLSRARHPDQAQSTAITHTQQAAQPQEAAVLRMKLVGANENPRLFGLDPQLKKSHYFIGKDPKQWHADVPNYARVKYQDIYPGIDLIYYGNQRQLEYDFVVAPSADPTAIRLSFEGADKLEIDPQGDLVLLIAGGEIRFHRPYIYQEVNSQKKEVSGSYVLLDPEIGSSEHDTPLIGFQVAAYDAEKTLVIDPVLSYSSYLGGSPSPPFMSGEDWGLAIAVDGAGNAYVTGFTSSPDFPTVNALDPTYGGGAGSSQAFVTKVNATGTALVYSTYLGGDGRGRGFGIAVNSTGSAYVTGFTEALNFPTTPNAFSTTCVTSPFGTCFAAFVTKLNPEGSALIYSTYLYGGFNVASSTAGFTEGHAIAVDSAGNAYVTGSTASTSFPTTPGAFQTVLAGARDAFVAKIDPAQSGSASLVFSTYLGGLGLDEPWGIAVDSSGNVYVAGETNQPSSVQQNNFPVMNAVQPSPGGLRDGFLVKLDPAGSSLIYSTYIGGSDTDAVLGMTIDASGNAYVTGQTKSANFPIVNALVPELLGLGTTLGDAFVSKVNASGSGFVYSTYLGLTGGYGTGVAADAAGNAYVTGTFGDAFIAKLNPAGSAPLSLIFLGGSEFDQGNAIALDSSGNVYLTGVTFSSDFPVTSGAFQTAAGGLFPTDAFVAKISLSSSSFTAALVSGFNLIGNALTITINVPATFGNQDAPVAGITSNVVTIWKWVVVEGTGRWAFYSPQLTAAGIASFAASKGYDVLATINPGEGYWVNAATPMTLPAQTGAGFNWNGINFAALPTGFNLIAHANSRTPSQFNNDVNPTPPAVGEVPTGNFLTLWAWDALAGNWYFYSPLLEASGGLPAVKSYADSHFFRHFQDYGKTIGPGIGFWVNRP